MSFQAKVLTVSTSVAAGRAEDRGGEVVATALLEAGIEVVQREVVADGVDRVESVLRELAAGFHGLVVTTGGTGFSPSDTTPEATARVIDRPAPGLAEAMRLTSPLGRLSRATAGTIGAALILNTPGSPNGAAEYLAAVLDVVPHVLLLLGGDNPHPHPGQTSHGAQSA
jgi:molybdenum cofactor synthesis domain-containing protein